MAVYLITIMWLITAISAQLLPTISNSSGDYFVTNNVSDFNYGSINCSSTKLCHIQCSNSNSCNNIKINCNDADICILDCHGYKSCQNLNLYVGSNENVINCMGYSSCTDELVNGHYGSTKIYTDSTYTNQNTVLTCSMQGSCDDLLITNIQGGAGYTDASKFKILCPSYCGVHVSQYGQYPVVTPTIINATGEYYFNIGSFVNISCSHKLLCSVDCSGGACFQSNINCGRADKCAVSCPASYYGDYSCSFMNILASNNKQFDLTCSHGTQTCYHSQITVKNVHDVFIDCANGAQVCESAQFNIESVQNVKFQCNKWSGSFPCQYMVWDMNMVGNFTGDCDGELGCQKTQFNINNTNYFDFDCSGSYYACMNLDIMSHGNSNALNLKCDGSRSCLQSDICIKEDSTFNLNCCGHHSCNSLSFCNETNNILTSIDCECETDSCINMTRPLPGTILPSVNPTTTTLLPTSIPAPTEAVCNDTDRDCAAECFGGHKIDACNQCLLVLDPMWNECVGCNGQVDEHFDCEGTCGDTYSENPCGLCIDSRNKNFKTYGMDCSGTCFGTKTNDQCGNCKDEWDITRNDCVDCEGHPNGPYQLNYCGACLNTDIYKGDEFLHYGKDCENRCNGGKTLDECGQCLATSDLSRNECLGCDQKPNSGKEFNECGYCVKTSDPNFDDYGKDCRGICNTSVADTYYVDDCGACLLPNADTWNACLLPTKLPTKNPTSRTENPTGIPTSMNITHTTRLHSYVTAETERSVMIILGILAVVIAIIIVVICIRCRQNFKRAENTTMSNLVQLYNEKVSV